MSHDAPSRRGVLAGIAAASVPLAGCSRGRDGAPTTPSDADYTDREARAVGYLTADPAAGNFDGRFADETGRDAVSVAVGAAGNGGNFAYAPPAVRVSTGTTVSWEWTGKGNSHNVQSVEGSDVELASELKADGEPYTKTLDSPGVALYYCGPHRSFGMKGAVVVE